LFYFPELSTTFIFSELGKAYEFHEKYREGIPAWIYTLYRIDLLFIYCRKYLPKHAINASSYGRNKCFLKWALKNPSYVDQF
jgi:hypothetical protein